MIYTAGCARLLSYTLHSCPKYSPLSVDFVPELARDYPLIFQNDVLTVCP